MVFLLPDASCTLKREMENSQNLMVVDYIKGVLKILGNKKFKRMMEIKKICINHPCIYDFQKSVIFFFCFVSPHGLPGILVP